MCQDETNSRKVTEPDRCPIASTLLKTAKSFEMWVYNPVEAKGGSVHLESPIDHQKIPIAYIDSS